MSNSGFKIGRFVSALIIISSFLSPVKFIGQTSEHPVFVFSQYLGHGREPELAPTRRSFKMKEEIIAELNGSGRRLDLTI